MGFYFRKSVRVGPLRFNLSKSGIGVSVGIPGLRVGTGPRGNYIHIGGGGFYYRQTLSPPRATTNHDSRLRPPAPSVAPEHTCDPMEEIPSGSAAEMVDSTSLVLLAELDAKQKRLSLFLVSAIASVATFLLLLYFQLSDWWLIAAGLLLLAINGCAFYWDLLHKSVVMMYDLDDETATTYRALYEALNGLGRVGGLWHVNARGDVRDPKYHAGAHQLLQRKGVAVRDQDPPYVSTNLSITRVPIGKGDLYFCPDTILVYASGGVGSIAYDDLQFECVRTRFIEGGTVPRDAKIIDKTWQYVNKKGGPDKRFKDNREMPICEYEEIRLRSSSGLNEILQVSRAGLGEQIERAASRMAASLATARSAGAARTRAATINPQHTAPVLNRARPATPLAPPPPLPPPGSPPQAPLPIVAQALVMPALVQAADAVPSMSELHTALFRLLCCVMVADGRASAIEKTRIEELMGKAGAHWNSDQTAARVNEFIAEVQKVGFKVTFEQALSGAPLFSMIGRQDILLKALRALAQAKEGVSAAEQSMLDRIVERVQR